MAETINPPIVLTAGNDNADEALSNAGSVIVRNRSGTQAAYVNIGYTGDNTPPGSDGSECHSVDAGRLDPTGRPQRRQSEA